ncbi:GNAT family N-acetyltransferase [Pelagibacterium sp.]|uniref:GNAT family N-acetyltransferase n=1 Tax=Pelagibacterium sp. TaxID=1967288 RepID=UPI003A9034C3
MSASLATSEMVPSPGLAGVSIRIEQEIDAVAAHWLSLEQSHCILPSQKFALVMAWIKANTVPAQNCAFVLISLDGKPAALLPLMRKRVYGLRVATWFTGEHLGAYAPLFDRKLWASVSSAGRMALWQRTFFLVADCDLVHLPDMPLALAQDSGLSAALNSRPLADSVHVSRYSDWASCDADRRDKHRRKVDRQQGNKLAGRGAVSFDVLRAGPQADAVIDTMFAHRAERFKVQGIRDPFRDSAIKDFYKLAMASAGGVLHVLRLDDAVIAVRYNIEAGGGLYSLITSMHPCPDMQSGSPGKQNLLRAMQASFDDGHQFVDMGKGMSEEKRLWCNEKQALMAFTQALTPTGQLASAGMAAGDRAKGAIKSRPALFDMYRTLRSRVGGWTRNAKT